MANGVAPLTLTLVRLGATIVGVVVWRGKNFVGGRSPWWTTVGVLTIVGGVYSGRKNRGGGGLLFEGKFMVDELLMKLFKRDGCVTTIDSVDNRLIGFIIKSFEDFGDDILVVHGSPNKSQLISICLDRLHVFGDGLVGFGDVLEVVLNLKVMTTRGVSEGRGKYFPRLLGRGGLGYKRNHGGGEGAYKSTENELALP